MKALWTQEEAEFTGHHRQMSRSWAWPKPNQPGGPPILLGARADDRTFERIAAWADGWVPVGSDLGAASFRDALATLRRCWDDHGRLGEPEICYFFYPATSGEMRRQIELGAELGVQRMQLSLGDAGGVAALAVLDRLAEVVASLSG